MTQLLKYHNLISLFNKNWSRPDYDTIVESARRLAKSSKQKMTDPFTAKNFVRYLAYCRNVTIRDLNQTLKADKGHGEAVKNEIAYQTNLKNSLLQEYKRYQKNGMTGMDVLVERSKDPAILMIQKLEPIQTMGEFFIVVIMIMRRGDQSDS